MSKLSEAKILGLIGTLMMLFSGVFAGIGIIIGLILVFIAIKYISEETKDKSIFDNYLMHFIFNVFAVVAVVIIFFYSIGWYNPSFFSAIESMDFTDLNSVWNFFEPYILWWVLALIIGWIFILISALYLKKSYYSIAKYTKVHLFRTTGLVYFIGAITLIFVVGVFVIFIAKILEIIAFYSLPRKLPG
jgi:uncharacterized membrane protein